MSRLLLLLLGFRELRINALYCTAFLNLCLEKEFVYDDFVCEEDGSIRLRFSYLTARTVLLYCKRYGIAVEIARTGGIPWLLFRYRRRWGLAVGFLISVVLVWLSGRYVWDIRITGNDRMTASEVRDELQECGLSIGKYIPSIRAAELENRVLIASDQISWISICFDGTVAEVQVVERAEMPQEEKRLPANLVAKQDGQIEWLELYRGNAVVGVGQAVRKGDLLVSGLYDSNTVGFRYTRASGKVLARTERQIRVEIPLVYDQKCYEEEKIGDIVLNFFGFSLKIFKKAGNGTVDCDIIKKEYGFDRFGLRSVPIWLCVEKRLPYRTESAVRQYDTALQMAYEALERELSAMTADAQLLQKSISTTQTDTALILDCSVVCIENIALQQEFEIAD